MSRTATMFYDGQVFRPESPLDLEPNRRYTVTLPDGPEPRWEKEEDAWDVLERLAGTVEAPPDWSDEHDHYIHGTPEKRRGAGGS